MEKNEKNIKISTMERIADALDCDFVYAIVPREKFDDIIYKQAQKKAKKIYAYATYGLFTDGLEKFDKAYEDGYIDGILGTNLTYRSPELLKREWFMEVDVSKYIAYFIAAINHDVSIGTVIDPHEKIHQLLQKYNQK